MPIKQERMIAVIEAGLAFQASRRLLAEAIQELFGQAAAGAMEPIDALGKLNAMAQIQPDGEHFAVLGAEREHFRRVGAKNIRDQHRRLCAQGKGGADPYIPAASKAGVMAHISAQRANMGLPVNRAATPKPRTKDKAKGKPDNELGEVFMDMGEAITEADALTLESNLFGTLAGPSPAEPAIPPGMTEEEWQAQLAEDRKLAQEVTKELDRQFHPSGYSPMANYTKED